MNTKVSYNITWITFAANLMIVIHHANLADYFPEKVTPVSFHIMNFFSVAATPMVPWFIFISAYLFFRKFTLSQLLVKWEKRIFTLVIPYIIWNTISVLLNVMKGERVFESGILNFFVTNYVFDAGKCANGPLWYLYRLIQYVAFSPVIYLIVKSGKKWFAGMIVILIIACNHVFHIGYFGISYFLPLYMAGAYIGANESDHFENFMKKPIVKNGGGISDFYICFSGKIICMIAIIVISYVFVLIENQGLLKMLVRYLSVIPMLGMVKYCEFPKPRTLVKSGMYFYCCHDIVFRIVRKLIQIVDVSLLIYWLLLIGISTILILLSYYLMRRYFPIVYKLLTGGR